MCYTINGGFDCEHDLLAFSPHDFFALKWTPVELRKLQIAIKGRPFSAMNDAKVAVIEGLLCYYHAQTPEARYSQITLSCAVG